MKKIPEEFALSDGLSKIRTFVVDTEKWIESKAHSVRDVWYRSWVQLCLVMMVGSGLGVLTALAERSDNGRWPGWGSWMAAILIVSGCMALLFYFLDRTDRMRIKEQDRLKDINKRDQKIVAATVICRAADAWLELYRNYAGAYAVSGGMLLRDHEVVADELFGLLEKGRMIINHAIDFFALKRDSGLFDANETDLAGWLAHREEMYGFLERVEKKDDERRLVNAAGLAPLPLATALSPV